MTEMTEEEKRVQWGKIREMSILLGWGKYSGGTHEWVNIVQEVATRHCVLTDHKWGLKSCLGCNPPE